MNTYNVKITEILSRIVEIEAESEEEAYEKAEEIIVKDELVLNRDFTDYNIEVRSAMILESEDKI